MKVLVDYATGHDIRALDSEDSATWFAHADLSDADPIVEGWKFGLCDIEYVTVIEVAS